MIVTEEEADHDQKTERRRRVIDIEVKAVNLDITERKVFYL